MSSDYLEKGPRGYHLSKSTPTHREYDQLCSDVRFGHQPAPGACTAFLIAPQVLVTAAHCLRPNCSAFHYVFDFLIRNKGRAPKSFSSNQVFHCEKVLAQSAEADWALLRLDRPVPKRTPLRLAGGEPVRLGTPVLVVGYPRGIPLKIADDARVVEPAGNADPNIYFEADLDTFGGNSGGPVLNAKTLAVEGILAVGFGQFDDETTDPVTGLPCRRLRVFSDPKDATPAWIVRSSQFREVAKPYLTGPRFRQRPH